MRNAKGYLNREVAKDAKKDEKDSTQSDAEQPMIYAVDSRTRNVASVLTAKIISSSHKTFQR